MITIRGARAHNLKSIDVEIQRASLTVVTGPSGSGKSSFAFHTLYAEAQRRYMQCLGLAVRRQLSHLERPDYDLIEGLPPAIAVKQEPHPESGELTVALLSEIYDHFRILYAAVGIPHDPQTGELLEKMTPAQVVEQVLALPEGTKVMVMAPLSFERWTEKEDLRSELQRQGFVRVYINGELRAIEEEWESSIEDLKVVVDRLIIRDSAQSRLADSVETALQICGREVTFAVLHEGQSTWKDYSYSTCYRNPRTGFTLSALEPNCFSYHSHLGRCDICLGKGTESGESCPRCGGGRLKPEFLAVLLPFEREKVAISHLCAKTVAELQSLLPELTTTGPKQKIVEELQAQIRRRLGFLAEIGLGDLELDRKMNQMSGGERQRVRLAQQLGAGLSGILYVIDEPSIGLHPADTHKLITILQKLRDQGNTLIVVEHDLAIMQAADHILDFGPVAGEGGGYLLAQGTAHELAQRAESATGRWLQKFREKDQEMPPLSQKALPTESGVLHLTGAKTHHLKEIRVSIPLGQLVVVTGVSGSGKSSLVQGTLYPALRQVLNRIPTPQGELEALRGYETLGQVVMVDQQPLGKTARSSPATYTGAFELIRKLYASLPLSKQRGYQPSRFSFNVKGGRCETCLGVGVIRVDLQFLSDAQLRCDACGGSRYNRETQEILFKGRSIAEVLEQSISENAKHFAAIPKLNAILESLLAVGLGYLKLGQPASTLSGGESQRVKIATQLAKLNRNEGKHLYLLDEPTSGLHFSDVEVLLAALRCLTREGHSVVVIEHNEQFVAAADWQIELGPGSGTRGGEICYEGVPRPYEKARH